MKPAPFRYHAPRSLDECLELLATYGAEAKVLAGGQSLMPMMNFRLARPAALIDINYLRDLDYIALDDGTLRVGALTRQSRLERHPATRARLPLVGQALALIGHPAIRTRGTVAGSIAHADPAAELPAVLLCLDGSVVASSAKRQRVIRADDLFQGPLTTVLEPDELVVEARFRVPPPGSGAAVLEVARRHGDFALVGAAATVQLDASRRLRDVRLTLFGAGPVPMRCPKAEQMLVRAEPSPARLSEVGRLVADSVEPGSDLHASADYRRRVSGVLAQRALSLAVNRSSGEADA
jgi:carbon-monoxide dehydrogenase medium subunit